MSTNSKDDIEAKTSLDSFEDERDLEILNNVRKRKRKKREMNPLFKDVEKTGKWGQVGKKEKIIVAVLVVIISIAGLAALVGILRSETDVSISQKKLNYVIQAFEENAHDGAMWDKNSMPRKVDFYSTIDSSAPARQRAMQWLLTIDEYEYKDASTATFRYAAASLYYALGGENWVNSSNWLSSNHQCDWYGLKCEVGSSSVVREVNLERNNLEGEIPEEIALLGPVKSIWLNNNKLYGSVPVSFGKLKELTVLYLESNQLTGQLPKAINENGLLSTIYIQHNNFDGDWPFCFFGYNQIKNYGLDCDKVVCRLGCCDDFSCYYDS